MLPTKMCYRCCDELERAIKIRELCRTSDAILRSSIQQEDIIIKEEAEEFELLVHESDVAQPECIVWIKNEETDQTDASDLEETSNTTFDHQESIFEPSQKQPKNKKTPRDKKVCPICGKSFTSWYLTIHLANHKEAVLKSNKTGKIKQIVNEHKSARQKGEPYVDAAGTSRNKRQVKPACESTCHMKCFSKFTSEQRLSVHKAFWSLNDAEKRKFYNEHLSKKSIVRRKQGEIIRKHNYTVKYSLTIDDMRVKVCRIMFINTLDISVHRIYHFMSKDEKEQIEYNHGKCKSRFIKEEDKNIVREHIRSIPFVERNGEKYVVGFPHGLSMYADYVKKHTNRISSSTYRKIINTEFKLLFQKNKRIREAIDYDEEISS